MTEPTAPGAPETTEGFSEPTDPAPPAEMVPEEDTTQETGQAVAPRPLPEEAAPEEAVGGGEISASTPEVTAPVTTVPEAPGSPQEVAAVTRTAAATSARPSRSSRSSVPAGAAASARTPSAGSRGVASKPAVPASASPAASSEARGPAVPAHPATLAIDIGGTGLKASVLDAEGRLLADRVRVATTYPVSPDEMVNQLAKLVQPLPAADRVAVGFPGVVRRGLVLTAPHFVTKSGPGSRIVKDLLTRWTGYDLAGALGSKLGIPVRVANDADLQGWAVIGGHGIEMVVTLGTGVGTALFAEGKLAPHIELAHHPFRKGETYNEQIGEEAMKRIGTQKWRRRVTEAIGNFERLVNYDHLYLGGGNARHMRGHVPASVTIVDNVAGIVGGIKLWVHGGH